jgi:hypothetical protein
MVNRAAVGVVFAAAPVTSAAVPVATTRRRAGGSGQDRRSRGGAPNALGYFPFPSEFWCSMLSLSLSSTLRASLLDTVFCRPHGLFRPQFRDFPISIAAVAGPGPRSHGPYGRARRTARSRTA